MNNATFSLICTSTGGPATIVRWLRDNQVISSSDTRYGRSQIITDPETATYENILVGLELGTLLGEFTCIVENARGRANLTVQLDSKC